MKEKEKMEVVCVYERKKEGRRERERKREEKRKVEREREGEGRKREWVREINRIRWKGIESETCVKEGQTNIDSYRVSSLTKIQTIKKISKFLTFGQIIYNPLGILI